MQINKLRNYLMKARNYDRMARPAKNHTTVTNVGFFMLIRRITDLDLVTRKVILAADIGMV